MADEIKSVGNGVSHGAFLEGYYLGGKGSYGHSGAGARLGYAPGITVLGGEHRLFLDPKLGGDVGHFNMDYNTPGGEPVKSTFTRYGGFLGAALRYAPPLLDHRVWAALGLSVGFGGFGTPESTKVALPITCVPGSIGRGECNPSAGPREGNAGTTGAIDTRVGSSKGTSGAYFNLAIPLKIGVDFARGAWGNLQGYAGGELNYTRLFPSGIPSFGYWALGAFLGIQGNFGGGAVEKPIETAQPPKGPEISGLSGEWDDIAVGKDAVDPTFEMTLKDGKVLGTLSGTMTGPDGKPASFEFVDKEVKSYPAKIGVRITQKPLTPGIYTLHFAVTSADKTKQAQGIARFRVSDQPTLKLDKFNVIPAEFHAGNKNVKMRMESSLKDGDKVSKVTLTFKKKKDAQDQVGVNVGIPPKTYESLTVGSQGMIEMEKIDLSALEGNAGYIVTATVVGQDTQVKQISTSVHVKPKADLEVKGLGATYVPGTIAPITLKIAGVDKIKVRVTVSATATVKPAWNKPEEEVSVVDSQIVEVTNAKEEKVSLRCQTADKKTVMIAEGGKNAKTGNYTVTFEAVNEKGEVIQPLSDPKNFSVAQPGVGPAAPAGPGKKSIKK